MKSLVLSSLAAAVSLAAFSADIYTVPKARRAPVADGVIVSGEYSGAMTFTGAANWRGAYIAGKKAVIDSRKTECAVTWDETAIRIAVRSETAPGGRLKTVGPNESIVQADSLEFWFNPPEAARNDEFARFGQFQMIVDSTGRIYARQHNPGYGLPARKWKTEGVKVANCVHGDLWDCEIEIPAAVFGAKRIEAGDWGAVLGRNFRTGVSSQATYMPFSALGGYGVAAEYPVLRLVESGAPSPFGGEPRLLPQGVRFNVPCNITVKTRVPGPVANNKYRRFFASQCVPTGYFGVQQGAAHDGRQSLLLFWHVLSTKVFRNFISGRVPAPGEETVISVNVRKDELEIYFDGENLGRVVPPEPVDPAALGELFLGGGTEDAEILSCRVSDRALTPEEIKADAQGDRALVGTLKWYPSETLIAAQLSFSEDMLKKGEPRLTVTDASGARIGEWKLPREGSYVVTGRKGRRMVTVHDRIRIESEGVRMKPGRYRAVLTAGEPRVEAIVKDFTYVDYPWFKTQLGRDDIVLPGFEPVRTDGSRISCVGRVYQIGGNGLPVAIHSLGRQILAAPVSVTCEKGGRRIPFADGDSFKVVRSKDTFAEYESAGRLLEVKGRLEQDGLLKLDLRLPRTPNADRFYLDIPVKKEFAKLYHASGEGMRSNPAGFIPAGKGRVFGSRSIPQSHVDNFIPYCWVGTDDRGICYAADVDRGWVHSAERDAVELLRGDDGTVTIRLNLLNAVRTGGPRDITVCIQASPVKPMPKGWRGWADTYFEYPCTRAMRNLASNPTWGCYIVGMARYPTFMDFDHVRKLAETVRTGVIDEDYKKKWIARCEEAMKSAPEKVRWLAIKKPEAAAKTLRDHVNAEFHYARQLHGKPNPVLYYYTCNADPCVGLYELETMSDEWGKYTAVYGSHQDYAIYYLDKMLEAGMTGVYNDNAFFRCNYDWVTGDAWIDEKGNVHPSFSLWALREHTRRQVVTMVKRGLDPWLTIHHTNANLLPALGYATNTMGMEWKYGSSEYQDRYTPDYIRTVNQGLQGGFFPTSLEGIFDIKSPEQRQRVSRTMFAALLPHEIRPTLQLSCNWKEDQKIMAKLAEFGFASADCVYTAYWNEDNPLVQRDDVLVSVYRRGKKLMCVIGSWADGDVELVLKPRTGRVVSAKDAETGKAIEMRSGTAVFPLKHRDFALVELRLD